MTRGRWVAVCAAAVLVTAVFVVTVPAFRHFFDLGVYRGAVRWWLADGGPLYEYRYQDSRYGFTYPPFAAAVLSPLALTSWPVAIAAGLAVNAAAAGLLLHRLIRPVLRDRGWPGAPALVLAGCLLLIFEPVRDTFSYGQVNLILLVLVLADLWLLDRSRWAGVGIGLAAAIKLTPAIFVLYLLVTRRWRAAAVATGTAAAATVLTALAAPDTSWAFWGGALWETGRVGDLAYVSNQSLRGVLARLDAPAAGWWWLAGVAAVLALWAVRVRRAAAAGDHLTGFALTGLAGCLISPITWVHHLVWALPAVVLLVRWALLRGDRWRLALAAVVVVLLSSSVVWLWWDDPVSLGGTLGGNTYVWICLGLLAALPLRRVDAAAIPPSPWSGTVRRHG